MGLIAQDVIDRVLAAHDVVEVVGRYVQLKQAGRAWKALCPFHEEKTASFTVNQDRQSFKCFGCGKGGTAITFLMLHHGLSFPEAVKSLARERGIEVPEGGGPAHPVGEQERILKALAFAQAFFVHHLDTQEAAGVRAYLEKRGYGPEARAAFGIGFAPPGWDRLLLAAEARRIPVAVLESAGLVVPRTSGTGHYDRFRHRITFPVKNLQGQVVSFGARAVAPEDTPKYLNGPETPVFRKSATLFALDMAREGIRRRGAALLMEGYTDVLMAHRHGFDSAVAGMGTAFTPQQAALLARFGQRVVLVYDADAAGRAAAEKAIDVLLEVGLEVQVARLPEGRDVDEILLEEGPAAFQAVLDAAQDLFAFRMGELAQRLDLATPRGRTQAAQALAATVAEVKNPVERDFLLRQTVERLGGGSETERALRTELAARLGQVRPGAARAASSPARGSPGERLRTEQGRLDELLLLAALAEGGAVADRAVRAVGAEDFTDPVRQRVYNAVLALREAGLPHDARSLLARFSDDVDASAELADLPAGADGPAGASLAERAERLIDHVERRRRDERRRQAAYLARGAQDQVSPLTDILDARPPKLRAEAAPRAQPLSSVEMPPAESPE